MIVTLQTERIGTLEEVRAFMEGNEPVDIKLADRASAYDFIRRTLVRFGYHAEGKAAKGLLKAYIGKATGLSRSQVTRLIRQHRESGEVRDRRGGPPAKPFRRKYTKADVRLLAEVDGLLGQASGPATRKVLRRMFEVFGDGAFERLAGLSNGHLHNLRKSRTYQAARVAVEPTRASPVAIGERRRPDPQGRPGFLRVDTVHQGDLDGVKGLCHINLVDEVTQWEHVGTVEAISERFLVPVLEGLIEAFPFAIKGFHADNASRRDAPGRSTSTTGWPSCSTSCTSGTSPSPAPGAPTTTRWWRGRTARWCASGSATATSPRRSPPRWTPSPRACCRRS